MATGNETLVKSNNDVFQSNKEVEELFGGDTIIIIYDDKSKETGLALENVRLLAEIETEIMRNENIFSNMSVTSIIKQLMLQKSNNQFELPQNQVLLDDILYNSEEKLKPLFNEVMLTNKEGIIVFKLAGNLSDDDKDEIVDEIEKAFKKTDFKSLSYTISGKPALDKALRAEMKSNMLIMVILAVVIMLIILAIIFRVRWRILSLGIVLSTVVTTLGLMGYIGVDVTMVSMAVFPILIGLGINYSIQLHSRFEEDLDVVVSIRQVGKAVLISVLATLLGFVSLFYSPVPMIQDFGLMLAIGIIISFIGALLILMPILRLRKNKPIKKQISSTNEPKIEKVFAGTTNKVLKFSTPILIVTVILSALGFFADSYIDVETDIETFMPQDMEALEDIHYIRAKMGSTDQVILYLQDDNIITEENITWIKTKTVELIENYEVIISVQSFDNLVEKRAQSMGQLNLNYEQYKNIFTEIPNNQKQLFITENNEKAIIQLNIKHLSTNELQTFLSDLKNDLKDTDMKIEVTGKAVLDIEMVNGLTSGRITMTIIGLVLIFLALIIIYRNVFKALLPIIPVALIIGISSGIMYLLGIKFTPITATLGALVLGMGTEMTIMLMERYLEERANNHKLEAIIISVKKIGTPILASGLTTVGGFSVLLVSKFIILQDFGLMTLINITLALLSIFIILPPLIILFDKYIYKDTIKN
jgi:hydrophobe/amphiphile efflux-3 (HAE3) family protein